MIHYISSRFINWLKDSQKYGLRIISVKTLLTLIMILFSQTAIAFDFQYNGIYYTITRKPSTSDYILWTPEVKVSAYSSNGDINATAYKGNVSIPQYVNYGNDRYYVTEIADFAFYGCEALTSVSIPSSVESVSGMAFAYCSSLTSITVNSNNKKFTSYNGALYDKGYYTLVAHPSKCANAPYLPSTVTTIGKAAFTGNNTIETISLDYINNIEEYAFADTEIKNINLGTNVRWIGDFAFGGCSNLQQLVLPSSLVLTGKSVFVKSGLKSLLICGTPSFVNSQSLSTNNETEFIFLNASCLNNIENPEDIFDLKSKIWVPQIEDVDLPRWSNFTMREMVTLDKNYSKVYDKLPPTIQYTRNIAHDITLISPNYINAGRYDFNLEFKISDPSFVNYSSVNMNFTIPFSCIINKAPITISALNQDRLYGENNTVFRASYHGFMDGDNEDNSFSQKPIINTSADKSSDVGEYEIIPSGGASMNYEVVTYQRGTLTINKAPLSLTALNTKRLFFEENPQFSFSLAGLRNNDDASCITTQPTYQCSADISSDCGEYEIIPSNAETKNYDISYINGMLTIEPVPLTLKARNVTREYGEENPILGFDAEGLKGSDNEETALQSSPTIIASANPSSNTGDYPITITGGSAKNYILSYRSGILTITKAPLSVIANDAERIYGDSNPTFVRSYLGFKLSDSESTAFSVLPQIECSATKISNVGEYSIIVSGGISRNYEIAAYENAILTVKPATATIVANDASRLYFEDNPNFDFTVSGLCNGDTKASITMLPHYNCTASKISNAGSYEITPFGANAQNYVFEYKTGNLTVNKRNVIASVGNYSRTYGTDNPEFVIVYTGFINNEDATVLNQPVLTTCEATILSDVGTYPILLSGGKSDNYNISSYNNGNLTIEKSDQTIIWNQDLSNIAMYSQVALDAVSTANLPVTYEMSPNNVATLYSNGGIWYLDCYGSGTVSIRAIQNGDKNHNAAPIITKTLMVYGNGGDNPSNPQIYLNVDEPGTLTNMIAENRKYQIKNLRLTGNLNGTDINFIREMSGSDSNGNSTPGVLETLDISGCTIVSGGRSYYHANRTSDYAVGNYMFYNCKVLTTLRLPDNSVSIGNSAFADCNRLSVLSIPNSVKSFGVKSFANAISLLRIPMPGNLTTIDDMAFMGCTGLTQLTLPENVSSIGVGIVDDCQNLSQINVEIGNNHFASIDGVLYDSAFDELLIFPVNHANTEYKVTEGVTKIAPYAFLNAKKLAIVSLPSTLTSIGKDAFIECVNLSTLQVKALTPPVCQNDCFENVSKTRCELQVPRGFYSYYWVAPIWSEFNRIVETTFTGIEDAALHDLNISVENGEIKIFGCPIGISVRIYQTNGTLVFNQTATDGMINFATNTSGVYIIVIGNKTYKLTLK